MKLFNERGYVFIAFTFLLPLFILLMSLALELGRGSYRQAELQNIADAAALAAVSKIENQNSFHLVSNHSEEAKKEKDEDIPKNVTTAADNSIEVNDLTLTSDNIVKELWKDNSDYYYCVKIRDHVPLILVRTFLPESFMPEGLPVSVVAWAKAEHTGDDNGALFNQAYEIGWNQTAKLMADVRDHGGGNSRAERIDNNEGIHYNYSKGADGNVSMSRTEEVNTRTVKTWKYMFVEFQPDIQMDVTQGIKIDGQWNFPFEHWDGLSNLADSDLAKLTYGSVFNLDGGVGRRAWTRESLIQKLTSVYGMSRDEAVQMLTVPIENVVVFDVTHPVRGSTAEALAAWEAKKMKETGWVVTGEKKLADYLGNESLAQLVARNTKGEIAATDPLLVRIESEDITRLHSYSNENLFYASSVRALTLKINIDNMANSNRPLIIYYFGPQDSDENVNAGRVSQPVTLELNANFKGILFAPYSPVIIKDNGNNHKIKGMVIGKSFILNGITVNPWLPHLWKELGFTENRIEFDDFEMFDIPDRYKNDDHVFMTSDQSRQIK